MFDIIDLSNIKESLMKTDIEIAQSIELSLVWLNFAGGQISSGIEKSLDLIDFNHKVQKADLVVVGEGRMDLQSLSGKAPVGVAKRTPEKIPVIAICGSLAEDLPAFPSHHIEAAFSIVPGPCEVADALAHAERNLISCARNIGNLLKIKAN